MQSGGYHLPLPDSQHSQANFYLPKGSVGYVGPFEKFNFHEIDKAADHDRQQQQQQQHSSTKQKFIGMIDQIKLRALKSYPTK